MDPETLGLLALLLSAAVMLLVTWTEVWLLVRMHGFPPVQWLRSNRRSLWVSFNVLRILVYTALAAGFFWAWLCLEPPFLSGLFGVFSVGCALQASVRLGTLAAVMVRLPAYDRWVARKVAGGSDTPGVPGSGPEKTGHPE